MVTSTSSVSKRAGTELPNRRRAGNAVRPEVRPVRLDGWLLGTNDDYGDTYASRLYWEAPSSGERYVAVKAAQGLTR